jgi:predicted hydrolase (HD superfamily)
MSRDEALELVDSLVTSPNLKKHLLASEAAMRALAERFEKDRVEDWDLVGLLHDADQDITGKSLELHTVEIAKKLKEMGVDQDIIDAIQGHAHKEERTTIMAKGMYAVDELTGLIVACALVRPEKKLETVTVEGVLKKFKEKSFASGANRDQIMTCESELQIPLADFTELTLKSMQKISGELGL